MTFYSTTATLTGITGLAAGSAMSSFAAGNFDYGSARLVFAVDGDQTYVINGTTLSTTEKFKSAGFGRCRGLHYDGTRFVSQNTDGGLYWHGADAKAARAITASYSWYDGVGTVRETQDSPAATFNQSPRTWLNVSTEEAPDSGDTSGGVDLANRVGIYVGIGAAARRVQSYLGLDENSRSKRLWLGDVVSTATATAKTSNGFVGATLNSPGVIKSDSASSTKGFSLDGSGAAAFSDPMGGLAFLTTQVAMGGSTNQSISGTTPVAVSNISQAITCPGPAAVYEVTFASWELPASGHTQVTQLAVDGTIQTALNAGVSIGTPTGVGTKTYVWRLTGLTAGSHTISARGSMSAAGQTGGYAGGQNTSMIVKRIT